ncbi:MAG: undecaprenyl/decaprenyl-phosphate alpha-N-acetylglucosaminyl 1-phosphate transferase [candidate division NC10 bacterium]|nr:undecaprenyl/decaprenyl-phosphate alpha-N-acetylglucosaminyl 1-phosphate transferase [candidate division NC10 bacterium]
MSPAPRETGNPAVARFSLALSASSLGIALLLLLPPIRGTWLTALGSRWAYILVLSGLVSFGCTPLIMRLAFRYEALDYPASRKVHTAPTPLLGGLAVFIAFLISVLANSILDHQVIAILIGAGLLVVTGVLDDLRGMPARFKLLAQLAAVAMVMASGVMLTLPPRSDLGVLLNGILTVVWILGITNAMNFFDGMDGLATGLSIVTASFLGVVAIQTFQPFLGWLAAALVGSCFGFFPFNFRWQKPAAIFLGDAGSTFLGFVLASLAVKGDWADNGILDLAAPILIFWIFIFDMTHITVMRIATGKVHTFHDWIAYVGRDHLHHRLDALLHSHRKTVLLIFLLSTAMGLGAVALRNARVVDALILILQAVIILLIVSVLERAGQQDQA